MASASTLFSRAMASRVFRYSIWATPMFVMMAASGFARAASGAISPGWFIPISQTAAVSAVVAERIESGTPMWLLKFPSVLTTRKRVASTAAANSFVLVFPLLPVMQSTFNFKRDRQAAASRVRASSPEAASRTGKSSGSAEAAEASSTSTAAAPRAAASAGNRLPSKLSPRSATYRSPGRIVRVSLEMRETFL